MYPDARRSKRTEPDQEFDIALKALSQIPLFKTLSQPELKTLAHLSELVSFRRGHDIVREGEFGQAAFIVVSGKAAIGSRLNGGTLVQGVSAELACRIFGGTALFGDVPYTATVRANSTVQAVVIERSSFRAFMRAFPRVAADLNEFIVEDLACLPSGVHANSAAQLHLMPVDSSKDSPSHPNIER